MSKTQNRNRGIKRMKGNKTSQNNNNNLIEDLMESEGDETPVADVKRMIIRMFNEFKEKLE
jgi:hypothetical protein